MIGENAAERAAEVVEEILEWYGKYGPRKKNQVNIAGYINQKYNSRLDVEDIHEITSKAGYWYGILRDDKIRVIMVLNERFRRHLEPLQ